MDGTTEPITESIRAAILDANASFAHQALRVLAMAQRRLDREPDAYRAQELEDQLVFLGLAALKDPLRPEVKAAVQGCHDAGIRTVMITGDHKDTAVAIAEELRGVKVPIRSLSGMELDRLSDEELVKTVDQVAVYARVSAEHKLRIVKAWKLIGWGKRVPFPHRLGETRAVANPPARSFARFDDPDLRSGAAAGLGGIVESFLSQYHEPVLPYSVKIAFGLTELVLLTLFLSRSCRSGGEGDNAKAESTKSERSPKFENPALGADHGAS